MKTRISVYFHWPWENGIKITETGNYKQKVKESDSVGLKIC